MGILDRETDTILHAKRLDVALASLVVAFGRRSIHAEESPKRRKRTTSDLDRPTLQQYIRYRPVVRQTPLLTGVPMTALFIVVLVVTALGVRAAFRSYKKQEAAQLAKSKELEMQVRDQQRSERNRVQAALREQQSRARFEAFVEKAESVFARNIELIEKFLEIAERKVSILDEYGDENWKALPAEIRSCLKKIADRENLDINWKRFSVETVQQVEAAVNTNDPLSIELALFRLKAKEKIGEVSVYLLYRKLEKTFRDYHSNLEQEIADPDEFGALSGVEFETRIAKVLKEFGFNVSGTRASGDQGADLIAKRDGSTIIIQAKRYDSAVGNKAVQEVIGAVQFYSGDEGWVITNSTFTPSAKALAQKANIRLIDGPRLAAMAKLIRERDE